ncbi:MAG: hypothetical protein GDA36_13550 [Rhodobacteraceae bacterium]|nr:hypothetical protein [Paracoccaceae bacterium]
MVDDCGADHCGAAAGFLATQLMRLEAGIIPTIVIGIAGAVSGALVQIWVWPAYFKC